MLTIDREFQELIPPLTQEEYNELEASLREYGCLDAIKVWKSIIIDGHNRYEICNRLNIPFEITCMEFEDRNEAKLWMMHNQLARRNISELQKIDIVKKCEAAVKAAAKKRQATSTGGIYPQLVENLPQAETGKSRDKLGSLAGVSGKTYEHGVTVLETAPEPVKKAALNNQLSINKAYEVTQLSPEQQAEIAERLENIEAEPEETNTPAKIINDVARPFVVNNSGNNEWYTPSDYIELARKVMGNIDLDPASCELANKTVQATTFFSKEDNGLEKDWYGNVWMNPPYSSDLIGKFVDKLVNSLENISNAIVLVNNATDTGWFRTLITEASAVCFTYGRIKFNSPDKKTCAPLQGQALLYFGNNAKGFVEAFNEKGWCAYPV